LNAHIIRTQGTSAALLKKFPSPVSAEDTDGAAFTPLPSIVAKPKIDATVHMVLVVFPDMCMCVHAGYL